MSLETRHRDDVLVVSVAGVLDVRSAPLLAAIVTECWSDSLSGLCIELVGPTRIEYGGLPALLEACRRASELGREFVVRSRCSEPRRGGRRGSGGPRKTPHVEPVPA